MAFMAPDFLLAGVRVVGALTLGTRQRVSLQIYSLSNERNSERVRASSLKAPSRQEVFMIEFCFSTPRIIMQRCFASTTTATPLGSRQFISDSAIWVVRFS